MNSRSCRSAQAACEISQSEKNCLNTMQLNNSVFKSIMNSKDSTIRNINILALTKASTHTIEATTYSEMSRDTNDWVPPNHVKSVESIEVSIQEPGCSRELFNLTNVVPFDKSDVNSECDENILVLYNSEQDESIDEIDYVGKAGLKRQKRPINIRTLNKKECLSGTVKTMKPDPCKTGCRNNCSVKLPEEARKEIFKEYWSFENKTRQRDFLLNCTETVEVKRSRVANSRKKNTKVHYLYYKSEEHQVCQQYLLKTLDISQKLLDNAVKNQSPVGMAEVDKRIHLATTNNTREEDLANIDTFIQTHPAVLSNYCRALTTKKYPPANFVNIKRLYFFYQYNCANLGVPKVSERVFRSVWATKYNIGFHLPKKDKCMLCTKFDNIEELTNEQQLLNNAHIKEKDECKKSFLFDQESSKVVGSNFLCLSFDLQKVLNTPHGETMNLYYSRKYSVYNSTIYESGTRNSFAYIWGESEGQRGCNEIVSGIYQYLCSIDRRQVYSNLSLNCDSCAGQNKNRAMIAMLKYFLTFSKYVKDLKITFLLPGHTYMPVDLIHVHATIENFVKKRTVWAPSEWPTVIRNAKTEPSEIHVQELTFKDFFDWKTFSASILPITLKSTDNKIIQTSKLRIIKMKKIENSDNVTVQLFQSYDCSMKGKILKTPKNKKISINEFPRNCYDKQLPISDEKYKDLMRLCKTGIIPKKYHNEYINMLPQKDVGTIDT